MQDERTVVMEELEKLESEHKLLLDELASFKDSNPEYIEEKRTWVFLICSHFYTH